MTKWLILLVFFLASCAEIVPISREDKKPEVIQSQAPKKASQKITKKISKVEKKKVKTIKKFVKPSNTKAVLKFCRKTDKRFLNYGWGLSHCDTFKWHHVRNSVNGDPLMWVTFGDEKLHKKNRKDMTLILCGVHGDEITPVKFCYDILYHLRKHQNDPDLKDKLIAVAPIANPDSFFKRRPTRTNARGVDINRNLPTKDWKKDALRLWKRRYRKDPRRFPGKYAMSEPETLFQVNLILRYKPSKIVSVHAPLTLIDYDGPENTKNQALLANQLLIQMSKQASGYQIKNYPFFPGSLGNYAGNEKSIPTYTLELPSSDNRKSKAYWRLFKDAIHTALTRDFRQEIDVAVRENTNNTKSKTQ